MACRFIYMANEVRTSVDVAKLTLDELGDLRVSLREQQDAVFEAIRVRVVDGIAAGELNESQAQRRGKVDRMTVRKWLGKR